MSRLKEDNFKQRALDAFNALNKISIPGVSFTLVKLPITPQNDFGFSINIVANNAVAGQIKFKALNQVYINDLLTEQGNGVLLENGDTFTLEK